MPNSIAKSHAPIEDPFNVLSRAVTKLFSLWVSATYPFSYLGSNLYIHPTTNLSRQLAPWIKIGHSVIIRNYAWFNAFDLSEAEGHAKITIDDNCVVNAQCVISAKNHIHVERNVMVSACSLIMDHNHAYEDTRLPIQEQGPTPGGTIRIEQGCWIGHGAAIVCNQGEIVLGRNSVVAANALVTRSFPPYSVIVGNPARLARQFDAARGSWIGAAGRSVPVGEH